MKAGVRAACVLTAMPDKVIVVGSALQRGLRSARLAGAHCSRQLLAQLQIELTGREPQDGPLS
jgi:TetR/AcrR family transcriptional repressor of nem operon